MSGSKHTIGNLLGGRCDPYDNENEALDHALNNGDVPSAKDCYTVVSDNQKDSMTENGTSCSTISSTSTDSTEPFEEYRHKVQKLCLQPSLVATHLEELGSGGYNRVIAIDCDMPNDNSAQARYVLRVPNSPTECNSEVPEYVSLKNQVAMLNFLSTQTPLKIATVVSFDTSYSNPLGCEYTYASDASARSRAEYGIYAHDPSAEARHNVPNRRGSCNDGRYYLSRHR